MVELMEHQQRAVEQLANGQILWGGVGSGKSLTVLAYYMEREAPKDIYVITTAKKRDTLEWEKEAAKFGIGTHLNGTTAGLLVIDSWNNIGKYIGVEDAFFIFDEQRVVGSGAWVKSFQKIAKKNNWVLLSATPGDTWLDYIPVFVANGFFRNATEFKREHIVYAPFSRYPKIVRYNGVATLEKYRNIVLVEMPYLSHTNRIEEEILCEYDAKTLDNVIRQRWNPYTNKPIVDAPELFRVMRRIVITDPSRMKTLKRLISTHPKVIVFYNFDYELETLRELSLEVPTAEWNGHRHQPIPKTKRWVYLVQYTAGAEGWNCVETDTVVFYSLTYSYKNLMQAKGRIDRLDTPFTDLYYYIFMSDSVPDRAVRRAQKEKRLFNEVTWALENL